jgi:multiple sugar transport system permease protein
MAERGIAALGEERGSPARRRRWRWRRAASPTAPGPLGLALLAPALVLLLLVVAVPFLLSVDISFLHLTESNISRWIAAPWAGLENYSRAIVSQAVVGTTFLDSLFVSVVFSCLTTLIILPIGFVAALSCDASFRGRAIVRSLYLMPYVMPHVVTAILGRMLFSTGTGLVDETIGALHLGSREMTWLLGPNSFWAMLAVEVWSTWGLLYLLVLAGLQGIDRQMYEAAEIDGASRFQKLRSITLPSLRNLLALGIALSTMFHFANFTLAFVMFGTSPPSSAFVLPLNLYVTAFNTYNFGAASAGAVVMVLIVMIPVLIYIRLLRVAPSTAADA